MYTSASQLDRAIERLSGMVAERHCRGVVAARDGGSWKIVALLVQGPDDPLAGAITASCPGTLVITVKK